MSINQRESFAFFRSFFEGVYGLPSKDRLSFYEAIFNYALNGIEPSLNKNLQAMFLMIRPVLDKSRKMWENGCKGAEHGSKGGAPKGNKNAKKQPQINPQTTPNQPQINPQTTPDKNKKENKKENKEENKENNISSKSRFATPTLEEVNNYISAEGLPKVGNEFFFYYESIGWKVGRNPMKDWKSSLKLWASKNPTKSNSENTILRNNNTDKFKKEDLW